MQEVSAMAEASKSSVPSRGKSTPMDGEEAGVPRKRKSTGIRWKKGVEENGGEKGGTPGTGKSAARMEEECQGTVTQWQLTLELGNGPGS